MNSAILWGGLAAFSLLVGYYLARFKLSNLTIGIVMGFGAGALLSAIAYELVPESILLGWGAPLFLFLGAVTFTLADWMIDRSGGADRKNIAGSQDGGSGAAIFIGTLLDNVPESIVLGMSLAYGGVVNIAFLTAMFVSNLPEGIAGTINLEASGRSRQKILWMWVVLIAISAACAGLGYLIIQFLPGADGRYVQAFAAGAMLTMLADAMMPEGFEHGGKLIGLITVLGFLVAAMLSIAE